MNRDLSRRVRTVNGITSHKQVVRADIKLAAKIIQNLDARYQLWPDLDSEQRGQQVSRSHSRSQSVSQLRPTGWVLVSSAELFCRMKERRPVCGCLSFYLIRRCFLSELSSFFCFVCLMAM